MQVVPVLDLKDALVVLAAGGQRDSYRPIDTALCSDPAPLAVVAALLNIAAFETFYIADLDAIQGRGANHSSIASIARAYPDIEIWVDAGFATPEDTRALDDIPNTRLIVGSESVATIDEYLALFTGEAGNDHILSLDRKDGVELGPPDLIDRPELWPDTVISMDLTRVGQAAGPNIERIRALQTKRPGLDVVAAGGIRHVDDLFALAGGGVNHALVATALHNRNLTTADILELKKTPRERGVFPAG